MGEEIKRDFSHTEVEMLMKLLDIKNRQLMCLSDIAKEMNISVSSPYFAKILKYLIENQMLEVTKFGRTKLVKINHSKITDLIDEQEICIYWFEYFKKHHVVAW
jgi:predicted transcriptional regulator